MRCLLLNGPNWSPPAPPSTRREALSSSKTNSRKPAASTPNFNSKKADPAHHPNTPSTSDITPPPILSATPPHPPSRTASSQGGSVRAETSGVERRQCFRYKSINAAPSRRGVALGPPNAMSRRPKIRWAASDCAPVDPDTGPHGPSGRTSHPDLVNHGGTVSPQLAKTHTLARPPKTWVQKNFTPDSA